MSHHLLRGATVAAAVLAGAATGCTVINSPGDVVQPAPAVLLAAGQSGSGDSVTAILWTMDARTGAPLGTTTTMNVAGIVNDPFKDLWYVFEHVNALSADDWSPADGSAIVKLHVYKLDPSTGSLGDDLGNAPIVPALLARTTAVLRDRLVYIAYPSSSSGAAASVANQLAILDTSDPTQVHPAAEAGTTGLIPLGSSDVAEQGIAVAPLSTTGGRVNVMWSGGCSSGSCTYSHATLDLPGGGSFVSEKLGTVPVGSSVGFGAHWSGGADVFFFPQATPKTLEELSALDYSTVTATSPSFTFGGANVQRMGVAECSGTALMVDTKTTALAAVPLASTGTAATSSLPGASGVEIVHEPVTDRAFVIEHTSAGNDVVAYDLGAGAAPTLTQATLTGYSPTLRPNLIAAPKVIACP